MVIYPIQVPLKQYSGRDPAKRRKVGEFNELASRLEHYINERVKQSDQDIQQFTYGFIAIDLRLDVDLVRDVLFGVDAGHNGLTVAKPKP